VQIIVDRNLILDNANLNWACNNFCSSVDFSIEIVCVEFDLGKLLYSLLWTIWCHSCCVLCYYNYPNSYWVRTFGSRFWRDGL